MLRGGVQGSLDLCHLLLRRRFDAGPEKLTSALHRLTGGQLGQACLLVVPVPDGSREPGLLLRRQHGGTNGLDRCEGTRPQLGGEVFGGLEGQ
ncbi:hypothetical protein ACFFX0_00970 [Citricoccus parietis]|uniref:Uncharacterized protein n=1 Tax=Citricoccus parietis TaxID=592307 RepID=A0ABV5FT38_9MICC